MSRYYIRWKNMVGVEGQSAIKPILAFCTCCIVFILRLIGTFLWIQPGQKGFLFIFV